MSAPAGRRPPALGRWLLRLGLPRGPVAEAIAGDLEEEYRARRSGPRPAPAGPWYLRQVIGILWRSMRDRLRGRGWSSSSSGPTAGGQPPRRRRAAPGESLLQDLRFGVRMLARRPLFTAVAVVTLAVGIGVTTAIFSVVNALLWRPVPAVAEPSSIVEIYRGEGGELVDVAYGAFRVFRRNATTLDDVAGWEGETLAYADAGDEGAAVVRGLGVTGNYFSVLGVEPALGRFFAPHESFYPDVADEVVIGHDLWQRRYGGSPEVLSRAVSINGHPAEVIGVAPEGFAGHQLIVQRDVFVPVGLAAPGLLGPRQLDAADEGYLLLLGRLADGVGPEAVRQELRALGERFHASHGVDEPHPVRVEPYGGVPGTDRSMVTLFFSMLLVIGGMVLAIACVNVANMLLLRADERRRELAIRRSLGAGRWRVARQLLTESTLLFLIAGAAGALLAVWTTNVLVALYLPSLTTTRLHFDASPDARVFAFAFGIAALTGLASGLAPALGGMRSASGARNAPRHARSSRLRGVLVGGQMALTLVLLVAAGLMARAVSALESADPGFDVEGVLAVELRLELTGYDAARSRAFYERLLDEVRAIPGVGAAAAARKLPMAPRASVGDVYPEGVEPPPGAAQAADFNRVSPGYFHAAGIPLREGRGFDRFDDDAAPRVAVVNATMARRLWGDGSAVGERFVVGRGAEATRYQAVGVAAAASHHGLGEPPSSFFYVPMAQSPDTRAYVLIRSDDPEGTAAAVRAAVSRLDPDVPLVEVTPMREVVAGFSMGPRLAAWVAGVVGAIALLIGSVGVYGVTAFAVARRTHEIGVRIAVGASAADVRRLVLRSGMRAPLAGMAVGVVAAGAAAQLIRSLLYGIGPLDPWTYGAMVVLLGLVALGATLIPARRAAAMDPVDTLRAD